jgi:C_GCAxxG_C_C family probable redox protein
MIDQAAKRSRELIETVGYSCAESVLLAMAEFQGIQSDLFPRIATGFCGGMARTCGQCGAVSGAIMGIGLANGVSAPTDSREKTYAAVQKFMAQFEEKFGSTNCYELTGCDLGTPEGQARFRESGHIEYCRNYTEEAARMALTIVDETG